jgi:hypothetical protein
MKADSAELADSDDASDQPSDFLPQPPRPILYNGRMGHQPSAARAARNIDALAAPVAGDVVAHRGLSTNALRPIEHHALAIAAKKAKDFRDALKPGLSQPVDLTVKITGTIDVGNNQQANVKQKPDLRDVLAVVLGTLTPKLRTAATEEILKRLKPPRPEIELSPDWLGYVTAIEQELTTQEIQDKRGNVTGTLEVEVLYRGAA